MAKPSAVLRPPSPSCAGGAPPSRMCVTAFIGRAACPFSSRLQTSAVAAEASDARMPLARMRPITRRPAVYSCLLRLGAELLLARLHLLAERLEVEVLGLLRLREHLAFLFLDVVHDVFAKHGEGGEVVRVVGLHILELLDQYLRGLVLDRGFVHDVLVLDRLAHCRVEDFLLQRGVHAQVCARALDQLAAALRVRAVHFLELLERLLHLLVVFLQEIDSTGGSGSRLWHGGPFLRGPRRGKPPNPISKKNTTHPTTPGLPPRTSGSPPRPTQL